MTLSDLKRASAVRQGVEETQPAPQVTPAPVRPPMASEPKTAPVKKAQATKTPPASDGRTKMLGARVPLGIHREFQQHIFRAQEEYPDLTMQEAVPALIRLLRDDKVWVKFMAELENGE